MTEHHKRPNNKLIAGIVLGIAGAGLVSATITKILSSKPPPQKTVVQEVRIVRVPPPPPPDQPPPPPEEVDVPEPEPQPEPAPSEEPPPAGLGIDSEGEVGGTLASRPGGRDLVGSGSSALKWYAGLVQSAILAELNHEKLSRSRAYSVPVKVWVRDDGSVEKTELARSTGDREVDRAIEKALSRVVRVPHAAPAMMPQPMTVRLVARV
jgi:periplasmic protein TonB